MTPGRYALTVAIRRPQICVGVLAVVVGACGCAERPSPHGGTGSRTVDGNLKEPPRPSPEEERKLPLLRANALMAKGDYEHARAILDAYIEEPPRVEPLIYRALCHKHLGNYEDAVRDYSSALALAPSRADILVRRAEVRAAAGDDQKAILDFGEALALDGSASDAREGLAAIHLEKKEFKQAIGQYTKIIETTHGRRQVDALVMRGAAYDKMGRLDEATADFSNAIAAEPDNGAALRGRANANFRRSAHAEVIADLTSVISLGRPGTSDYFIRGCSYLAVDRPGDAEADLTAALDGAPGGGWGKGFLVRGYARQAKGDKAGARQDYQKAIATARRDERTRASATKALDVLLQGTD
jgi:tetratricopeptide (TPR) repeat protein